MSLTFYGPTFPTAKAQLHGFHPLEEHEARTCCAKGIVEKRVPIQVERQAPSRASRFGVTQIQNLHLH